VTNQPTIAGLLPGLSKESPVMNEITPFDFEFEGQKVRVIEIDGKPWWITPEFAKCWSTAIRLWR
jgi:hypothetical protein